MKLTYTDETGTILEYYLSDFYIKVPYQEEMSLDAFILNLMEETQSTRDLVRSLEDKLDSVEYKLKSEISYLESQVK